MSHSRQEYAPRGYKGELDECERDGFWECREDSFRRGIGEDGSHVPNAAEKLLVDQQSSLISEGNSFRHTIMLGDIGALNASAISCALALTLALLVLIVRNASLRLFCRPCLEAGV